MYCVVGRLSNQNAGAAGRHVERLWGRDREIPACGRASPAASPGRM